MAFPYPHRYGQHLHAQHTHLATPPPPQNIPLPPSRAGSVMSTYSRSGTQTPQPSPYRSTYGSNAYQSSLLGEGRSPSRMQPDAQSNAPSSRSWYSQSGTASSGSVYSQATASSHQQRYHQYPAPPVPPLNIHHRGSPPLPSAGPEIIAPVPRYPRTSPRAPSLLSRHEEPPSSDSESECEEVMSHMSRPATRSSQRPRASSPTPTSRTAVSRRTNASSHSAATASTVKRVQSTPSFVSGRLYFVPDSSAPPVPGIPVTMTPVSSYSTVPSGYATPTPGYTSSSATSIMTSAPSYTATPNQFAHPPFPGYVPPSVPKPHPVIPGVPPRKRTITCTASFADDGRGNFRKVSEYIDYEPKPKKSLLGKLFK